MTKKRKKKKQTQKICSDCNSFYPDSEGLTEFGICLNDEEFEPFAESLLEGNYDCCRDLIDHKKFSADRKACPDFEKATIYEIDENSELGRKLQSGMIDKEALKSFLLEQNEQESSQDCVEDPDWKIFRAEAEYAESMLRSALGDITSARKALQNAPDIHPGLSAVEKICRTK